MQSALVNSSMDASLRQEAYRIGEEPEDAVPYLASQATYEVRLIQPKAGERHASFMVVPNESVSYGYERNPADPRVTHSLLLEVDASSLCPLIFFMCDFFASFPLSPIVSKL